jgi:hypothetical protein
VRIKNGGGKIKKAASMVPTHSADNPSHRNNRRTITTTTTNIKLLCREKKVVRADLNPLFFTRSLSPRDEWKTTTGKKTKEGKTATIATTTKKTIKLVQC